MTIASGWLTMRELPQFRPIVKIGGTFGR